MFDQFLGAWQGTNQLYLEGAAGPALASPSRLTAAITVGKFLEIRYDWSYQGVAKEGLLLFGPDGKTAGWIDSFHQSGSVMPFKGEPLDVLGSYPAPEGPDWGWRIRLEAPEGGLRLSMFNITPEGKEEIAVLAEYTR